MCLPTAEGILLIHHDVHLGNEVLKKKHIAFITGGQGEREREKGGVHTSPRLHNEHPRQGCQEDLENI